MNYKKLLVESGVKLMNSGLTVETWGNISVRDPENHLIYLTPSAMPYDTIQENDIVVCNYHGDIVEGNRKPTSEKNIHIQVLLNRSDVNAVVHTHSYYATAFACLGETIPMFLEEAAQVFGDHCKTAKYALPGTLELANNCLEALGDKGMCCLLKSHGALCLGATMSDAFRVARVVEVTATLYQLILSMGKYPDPIREEDIASMQEFFRTSYKQ